MSFFNNFQAERFPGPICGNPVNGLCEKVCIQVKKVFDACIKQITDEDVVLHVVDIVPGNPVFPLTFVSAKNITAKGKIEDLNITRLEDKQKFARVQCVVKIPLEVIFIDANGAECKGKSEIAIPEDVILHIPEASIIPYEIKAVVGAIAPEGVYLRDHDFTVTTCISIILEDVVDVELLVPSYGYCPIPPCQEFNQEVCATFFELPLYPRNGE